MGAFGEAFVAYAQPLLDQTDGSFEQVDQALKISQLCYNLALAPLEVREEMFHKIQSEMRIDGVDFEDFRDGVLFPMLKRHEAMFPRMHGRQQGRSMPAPHQPHSPLGLTPEYATASTAVAETSSRRESFPGADRYAPCPCGSGRKYKFCCGKRGL